MRVTIALSADEAKALRIVAKANHRSTAGEIVWAVLGHLKANGYVGPPTVWPAEQDASGDEHPF